MPRLLRKSTLAQREESIALRTLKQEIKKPQKKIHPFKVFDAAYEKSMNNSKSSKLKALIKEEETLFQEESQRLYTLFCTIDELNRKAIASPSDSESIEKTSKEEQERTVDQAECDEHLTWDSSEDINSPEKDTGDVFDPPLLSPPSIPPALSKDRSESVSVNRAEFAFVYTDSGPDIRLEPVCRTQPSAVIDISVNPGLINQENTLLKRNNLAAALNATEEEAEVEGDKMDEDEFKRKLKALKGAIRRAEETILDYVADCVTADKDIVQSSLKDIRLAYNGCSDKANDIIDELIDDDPTDEARIKQIGDLRKALREKLVKNEKEVNERLLEVLATHAENKPPSEAAQKDENLKATKLYTRIGYIKEKANGLKTTILKQKMT